MRVICINEFGSFERGKSYEYWTNFGGLNHIVQDDYGEVYPFRGPVDDDFDIDVSSQDDDYWIWDYFKDISGWRDDQIDTIISEASPRQ